MKQILLHSTIY